MSGKTYAIFTVVMEVPTGTAGLPKAVADQLPGDALISCDNTVPCDLHEVRRILMPTAMGHVHGLGRLLDQRLAAEQQARERRADLAERQRPAGPAARQEED